MNETRSTSLRFAQGDGEGGCDGALMNETRSTALRFAQGDGEKGV